MRNYTKVTFSLAVVVFVFSSFLVGIFPTNQAESAIGVTITSLSPTNGKVGTEVTIKGAELAPTGNNIHFGVGGIVNVSSADGATLKFVVPSAVSACDFMTESAKVYCSSPAYQVAPGTYDVYVSHTGGTSNIVKFIVASSDTVTVSPTPTPTCPPGTVQVGITASMPGQPICATPSPTPYVTPCISLPNIGCVPKPSPTPIIIILPKPIDCLSCSPTPRPTIDPVRVYGPTELYVGDVIKSQTTPDVFIVNEFAYKRLFLNPVIFGFYGHLGGFAYVKTVASGTSDTFPTSGLFRNCETNDQRVYGVEITGEDTGTLHWVNTSGTQAVSDDPNFFSKVFCINNNEFNWYSKGTNYTSVNQVPAYSR